MYELNSSDLYLPEIYIFAGSILIYCIVCKLFYNKKYPSSVVLSLTPSFVSVAYGLTIASVIINFGTNYEASNDVTKGIDGLVIVSLINQFSKFSLSFLVYIFLVDRSRRVVTLLLIIIYCLLMVKNGARFYLFAIPFLFLFYFINSDFRVTKLIPVLFSAIFMAIFVALPVLNYIEGLRTNSDVEEFDFSRAGEMVYTKLSSVDYSESLTHLNLSDAEKNNIILGSLFAYYPRSFWQDKPALRSTDAEPANTLSRLIAEFRGGNKYINNVGLSPYWTSFYLVGNWALVYFLVLIPLVLCILSGRHIKTNFLGPFLIYVTGFPVFESIYPSIDHFFVLVNDFFLYLLLVSPFFVWSKFKYKGGR